MSGSLRSRFPEKTLKIEYSVEERSLEVVRVVCMRLDGMALNHIGQRFCVEDEEDRAPAQNPVGHHREVERLAIRFFVIGVDRLSELRSCVKVEVAVLGSRP